ncbi:class A beta-lactamase [Agromyces intestinalis]|uniref:Beta-lactamase n=1 Tax=Agromyces intestinalis TaxID=2592652 RepID=A0A5C1YAA7_9MICO|nr:class A beta-lactamase [Agromyces intestinalis]QEO13133.1 class A beta-lactamase [Agromyces intestinalis]
MTTRSQHPASAQPSLSRRSLLALGGLTAAGAVVAAGGAGTAWAETTAPSTTLLGTTGALRRLERETSVTIGVTAVVHGTERVFRYRGGDRFPMCSLFKVLAAGALVRARGYDDGYWTRAIPYTDADIVRDSIVLATKQPQQATPGELADAALRFSDNTAGNLLMRELGGPAAITAFAAELGATATRLDRWEPDLNAAIPGDLRDTSTPDDIARMYEALLLDDAAGVLASSRLREWMLRNATSGTRMRAGLTPPYELADKTGGGDYGVVNDAGVLWRPGRTPLTLAIMTRADRADAVRNDDVVARATRIVLGDRVLGG